MCKQIRCNHLIKNKETYKLFTNKSYIYRYRYIYSGELDLTFKNP